MGLKDEHELEVTRGKLRVLEERLAAARTGPCCAWPDISTCHRPDGARFPATRTTIRSFRRPWPPRRNYSLTADQAILEVGKVQDVEIITAAQFERLLDQQPR